jgi:hypothetical protein
VNAARSRFSLAPLHGTVQPRLDLGEDSLDASLPGLPEGATHSADIAGARSEPWLRQRVTTKHRRL